jgi:hypothetical protein
VYRDRQVRNGQHKRSAHINDLNFDRDIEINANLIQEKSFLCSVHSDNQHFVEDQLRESDERFENAKAMISLVHFSLALILSQLRVRSNINDSCF